MAYKLIEGGGVTTPKGFLAGACYVGVKSRKSEKPDVAIIYSEQPASCAAMFTTNKFCAAPVILDREILKKGKARAVVINSGNANAATGEQGIKDANGTVISPMDLRLVRRIVRDHQFRSTTPERTLSMWPNVVAGENKYIRPYRHTSDVTVNSIHIYEPCVLRNQAIPLLRSIAPDSPWFQRARELEARLMRFEPINSDLVPEDSMLREFIGQKQPVEGETGKVS